MMLPYCGVAVWILAFSLVFARDYKAPCGGVLRDSQGSFSASFFKSEKSIAQMDSCLWVIENYGDYMIKLVIRDMDILDQPHCTRERVEVEDEHERYGAFCGKHDMITPIFTRSNILYIHALSYHDRFFTFNATYSLEDPPKKHCGGILNSTSGWMQSLDRDNDGFYDTNLECIWTIEAKEYDVIVLHFMYMDIKGNFGCTDGDYIEIIDVEPHEIICGTVLPPMITSFSNMIKVRFHTDYEDSGEGFNLTFFQTPATSLMCGGIVNQTEGLIVSPDEAGDVMYYKKADCLWIISAAENRILELKIMQMEIEESRKCRSKYLLVYDDDIIYGKFCGFDLPSVITSASNILYVRFAAEDHFHSDGFSARYTEIFVPTSECGGYLNESSGWISSRDWGSRRADYPLDCFWIVRSNPDMEVEIDIRYINIDKSSPCEDYLMIYDDYSPREKICGDEITKNPFRSSTGTIYVRAHSRVGGGGDGFHGKYYQQAVLMKECGGLLNGTTGFITDPDRDENWNYDYNLDCLWEIRVREGYVVYLQFTYFDVETDPKCIYDFVRIYETDDDKRLRCGKYITVELLNKASRSNVLYVRFKTDGSLNYNGFHAKYMEIKDIESSCDRIITSPSGTISSSEVASFEAHELFSDCLYLIQVPDTKKVVAIAPFDVDIEWMVSCEFYFLEIDGTGRICGQMSVPSFRSRENSVLVQFRTYFDKTENTGFNLTFKQVADSRRVFGGDLTDMAGSIYLSSTVDTFNLECNWRVMAEKDHVIKFSILGIRLSPLYEDERGVDRFEVTEDHKVYIIYKGGKYVQLDKIITEYNKLEVVLTTDEWNRMLDEHFVATYSIIPDNFTCLESEYTCLGTNMTIPVEKVCDTTWDCEGGDDQRFCDFDCPINCTCFGLDVDCTGKSKCKMNRTREFEGFEYFDEYVEHIVDVSLFDKARRIDFSTNAELFHKFPITSVNFRYLEYLNVSHCQITNLSSTIFYFMQNLKVLDISYNSLTRLETGTFQTQTFLETLILEGNYEILVIESRSFSGLDNLDHLKLFHLHVGNIARNAFAEMKLSVFEVAYSVVDNVEDGAFGNMHVRSIFLNTSVFIKSSNLMFEGVRNVSHIMSDSYKFCCIRPSYLPEMTCVPSKTEFSTCEDLLGKERYVLWLNGLTANLGNILSFKRHLLLHRLNPEFAHAFFLLNMAVSDFLMGIYVTIFVSADINLSGKYAFDEETWMSSIWCQLGAMLSLLSIIVTSAFLLLLIVDRIFVIKFPSGKIHFTRKHSIILSVVIWIAASIVAVVPVLHSTYVTKETYSNFGVCLGLHMEMDRSLAWLFLLLVLACFGFITLLLTLFGHWFIHVERRDTKAKLIRKRLNRPTDLRVSRNVFILVTMDVLCLMSVSVLGSLGPEITGFSDEMLTWMAVIVASLVAAMNPVLFNLGPIFHLKEFTPSVDEQQRPEICTKGEFDQILSLMRTRCYWTKGASRRGFVCLRQILRKGTIDPETLALVAHGIIQRIVGLHKRGVTQIDLSTRDVFIRKRVGFRHVRTAILCHPAMVIRPGDKPANIRDLGNVLAELAEKMDTTYDNMPAFPRRRSTFRKTPSAEGASV